MRWLDRVKRMLVGFLPNQNHVLVEERRNATKALVEAARKLQDTSEMTRSLEALGRGRSRS